MRDLLPAKVFDQIAAQFEAGADAAVEFFDDASGDEDTITGTLVQSLGAAVRGARRADGKGWSWRTRVRKLRGRGGGAPEKTFGADAVIEIEVVGPSGEIVGRKLVPMQAKKKWTATDPDLLEQCRKMSQLPGGALAVDYRAGSYSAVTAKAVLDAQGDRRKIADRDVRSLGNALSGQFLECLVGSRDLYYDADREVMVVPAPAATPRAVRFGASYRVRTTVKVG